MGSTRQGWKPYGFQSLAFGFMRQQLLKVREWAPQSGGHIQAPWGFAWGWRVGVGAQAVPPHVLLSWFTLRKLARQE